MYGDREDIGVYLAFAFLCGADRICYGRIQTDLENKVSVGTTSSPLISQRHARADGYTNNYGDTIGGKDGDSGVYTLGDEDIYSHVGNLDYNLC